jgi:phosphoribosyl-ATP pyrophosphohydrolase
MVSSDDAEILARLEQTIRARRGTDPAASYVASLQAGGLAKIAKKLGEEAVETVIAALVEDDGALAGEAADLLFHLMVLLDQRDLSLGDAVAVLARREGWSGIEEKAMRSR